MTGSARGVRPGTAGLSVIVASVNGLPVIEDTLAALEAQTARERAEILVADRTGEETRRALRSKFPSVRVLDCEPRTSIPELRTRALREACGDVVVVLEDHCIPPPDWLERIADAHARLPHAAIAGAVANAATERAIDWAHFLCEYAALEPPLRAGETTLLAGNAASYKRAALESALAAAPAPEWELFLHRRLLARGERFWCEPALEVRHRISFGARDLLAQRFHFSRSFAGMRRTQASSLERIALVLGSFVVPPLVLWRTLSQALARRRRRPELARALPWLVLLALACGAGELVGALVGGGDSVEHVR